MALDLRNVDLATLKTLKSDGSVAALVSTRIYTRPPKTMVFPCVVMRQMPDDDAAAVFGPPVKRVWRVTYDLACHVHDTSGALCGDIHKAVCDVFEDESNFDTEFGLVGYDLLAITPGTRFLDWVPEKGTWTGLAEFTLMVQE